MAEEFSISPEKAIRVHKAARPMQSGQRCKDCGIFLLLSKPFFPEDTELIIVGDEAFIYDHNKDPNAVRCNQDFAPPDLAEELHCDADNPDELVRLRAMFSNFVDKLDQDRQKDLAGIYRYAVSISAAKYKQDPNDPTGWRRVW